MSRPFAITPLSEIAEVLNELGTEIEELGASLCRDPAFVQVHIAELQAIDYIAQKQRALASLLTAECPVTALDNITLEDLKERLAMLRAHEKNK